MNTDYSKWEEIKKSYYEIKEVIDSHKKTLEHHGLTNIYQDIDKTNEKFLKKIQEYTEPVYTTNLGKCIGGE